MKSIAVILAGGRGERFWPLSRISQPKQSLSLTSNKPLILETYERLSNFEEFYIVANSFLCDSFKQILPSHVKYIIEPEARNTAPAIGLACAHILQEQGDCVLLFETADHYYTDITHYRKDLDMGIEFSKKNDKIVLIGINPTSPHTGYGYIQIGKEIDKTIHKMIQFKEKPDIQTAENYMQSGDYVWNSGISIGKCSVFLSEIKKYMLGLSEFIDKSMKHQMDYEKICEEFNRTEKTSLEYGVYEKSQQLVVLRSTMPWDDVGDYNSLISILKNDTEGNFSISDIPITSIDSHKNIIYSKKKVALLGVEDFVIVETDDVIMVCKRDETQRIKNLLSKVEDKYK